MTQGKKAASPQDQAAPGLSPVQSPEALDAMLAQAMASRASKYGLSRRRYSKLNRFCVDNILQHVRHGHRGGLSHRRGVD
jgi:hypothetical protein